jgi:hypothetical protein
MEISTRLLKEWVVGPIQTIKIELWTSRVAKIALPPFLFIIFFMRNLLLKIFTTYTKHKSSVQIHEIKYVNHMSIYLRFEIDLLG